MNEHRKRLESVSGFIRRKPILSGAAALFLLTLAMFGDILFGGNAVLVGRVTEDMAQAEAFWRMLAFPALKHGHILLWNKYTFSGTPFFTESQIAILYPINWLHLILPLAPAINLIVAIHVFLIGFWMFLWAHLRGMRVLSSLFCGIALMFSGPFFAHVWAGHMNNLAAMSWVPLLLIAADMLLSRRYAQGMLLGSAGLAMQILAGQPQYTYYTLITLALYMVVNLIGRQAAEVRIKALLAMVIIGMTAVAIAAIQIVPVVKQVAESSRAGGGVSSSFAASLSFPPENFLTAVAPTLFGDMGYADYWGRWKFWEMSLFIGVTGLILAICGALCPGPAKGRKTALVMAAVLGVLALGAYTPLFTLLFNYFPGFSKFRGTSKFAFDAMIFIVLLAGMGIEALITSGGKVRNLAIGAAIAAVMCGLAASSLGASAGDGQSGLIGTLITSIHATGESYLGASKSTDPKFISRAATVASSSLAISAVLLALNAGLLWLRQKQSRVVYVMVAIGVVEVFTFARYYRATFPTSALYNPSLRTYLNHNLGDGRILLTGNPNQAMAMATPAIWGYDSFNLNRYAEFIAFATGGDPDSFDAKAFPTFRPSPLLALVRLRYQSDGRQVASVGGAIPPLPHVSLMPQSVVIPQRNAIFGAMASGRLDFATTAVLETTPAPVATRQASSSSASVGTIQLVRDDGDSMELVGDVTRPCTLLITDSYAAGWQARPLAGSDQQTYQLMPADYTLRGVPLGPGHQHLVVEFVPAGLAAGRTITFASLAAYVLGLAWFFAANRRQTAGGGELKPPDDSVSEPDDVANHAPQ